MTAMSSSYPDSNFLAVIPDGGNGVVLYQVTESDGSLKLCCSVSVPSMHAGKCLIVDAPAFSSLEGRLHLLLPSLPLSLSSHLIV